METGCGAGDSAVGPLALRFDTEMGPGFLESGFDAPAGNEPDDDLLRGLSRSVHSKA